MSIGPAVTEVALIDKTLIIGPSWVGDMVMAQALFKAIKLHYPQTAIDVLAPQWSAPLTARMPEVSASISMTLKHGEFGLQQRRQLAKKIKENHYQRCYVCPNSWKSALIPFLARIPKRIGWRGEWRYGLLNEVRILDKKRWPLMVERYLALGYDKTQPLPSPLLKPALKACENNTQVALKQYQLALNKPILVICPGAEFGPSKRWPENYYAQLANHYVAQNWQVWIFGSAKDTEVAKLIQSTAPEVVDLTGRTSLGDAIDLMSLATLVVTNDSGLMHIAAALNIPLVALYGSTDPGFTPPLNDKVKILKESVACSPCFKRTCPLMHHQCMQQLSVAKVLQAAADLLNVYPQQMKGI
nr:lipopolysaccharide heptosyltransferase II [Candidatus Berkiella aquae]